MKPILLAFVALLLAPACARSPYTVVRETRYTDTAWLGFSSRIVLDSAIGVSGGNFFFGTRRGTVYALDPAANRKLWKRGVGDPVTTVPEVADGKVFVGTADGSFVALSAVTGEKLWTHEVPAEVLGRAVALKGGTVLFGANNGYLYAVDAGDGTRKWQYRSDAPDRITVRSFAAPSPDGSRVYAGFSDGSVVALDASDGKLLWKKSLSTKERFSDVVAPLVVFEGRLLAGQFQGDLHAFGEGGTTIWSVPNGGSAAAPLVFGNRVLAPAGDGKIFSLDPRSGAKIWTFEAGRTANWCGMALWGEDLAAATYEGQLYVISLKDGTYRWRYDVGSALQGPPILLEDRLWLLTRKGVLFSLARR